MSSLTRFTYASLAVTRWRNGGGETREILSWPVCQSDFEWRASIATIAANGPFSLFTGIDRSITLLSGEGVHLHGEQGIDHPLTQIGAPYSFAGETPIFATLVGGVTTDFNIMTRRDSCSARVTAQSHDFDVNWQSAGLLYALRGEWQVTPAIRLAAEEGLYWDGQLDPESSQPLHPLQPDAQLLWVEITR
jgi:environmental stress-induced protein Ves